MLHRQHKIDLSNVTMVMVDTVCHELATMAIDDCQRHARFGDIKIFSDRNISPSNTVRINPPSSSKELLEFSLYEMPNYISTSHVMFVQWDGWILDSDMWRDEFLSYDYIGAPWWYKDGLNVGNSGFSLRSLRLIKYLAKHRDMFPPGKQEDATLCRQYRPILEKEGFTWAPENLACEFSFERTRPAIDSRHFGFHGMFNWPFVLSYEELNKRMSIARKIPYLKGNAMLDEIYGIWVSRWGFAAGIHRG